MTKTILILATTLLVTWILAFMSMQEAIAPAAPKDATFNNLNVLRNLNVGQSAIISGNSDVIGNSHVGGDQTVDGILQLGGTAGAKVKLAGDGKIDIETPGGKVTIRINTPSGPAGFEIIGNSVVTGDSHVGGGLTIDGVTFRKNGDNLDIEAGGEITTVRIITGFGGAGVLAVSGNVLIATPLGPAHVEIRGNSVVTGDSHVGGSQTVDGDQHVKGTKSGVVETSSGERKLYALESPTVRFIDEGFGTLNDGALRIDMDQIFMETIEGPLLVHLTPYGPANLYVEEIGENYFVVKSLSGDDVDFGWYASAFRKGYSDVRLEQASQ